MLYAIERRKIWIFLVLLPITIANPGGQCLKLGIFAGFCLDAFYNNSVFSGHNNTC